MEKDFTEWHRVKQGIQNDNRKFSFNTREVWLCSVGLNLGDEEDGKQELFLRPGAVLLPVFMYLARINGASFSNAAI